MTFQLLLSFFLGIGLAAASGFRVFVPLFALSLAARFGFELGESWEWVGGTPALVLLGAATLFEIAAYLIPWVDNILDSIAVPLAGIAGTLLMGLTLGGIDSEALQWGLAIIAGGGTAAAIKGTAATGRAASTATTGGIGNIFISSAETALASLLSISAFIWAPLAFILVLIILFGMYRGWKFLKRKTSSMNGIWNRNNKPI